MILIFSRYSASIDAKEFSFDVSSKDLVLTPDERRETILENPDSHKFSRSAEPKRINL